MLEDCVVIMDYIVEDDLLVVVEFDEWLEERVVVLLVYVELYW